MTNKVFILIMDAHHARLYEAKGKKILGKVGDFSLSDFNDEHARPERRSSYYQKQGSPSHFFDPHSEIKGIEREQFAADILERIVSYINGKDCKGLIIAAEPKMLGALRKKLAINASVKVLKEISKDLTHLDEHTLPESIFENISLL